MELEGKNFLSKVRKGYQELVNLYPDRIKMVNGDNNIINIQKEIISIIREKYKGLVC